MVRASAGAQLEGYFVEVARCDGRFEAFGVDAPMVRQLVAAI